MAKPEKATHEEVDYGPGKGDSFCYVCRNFIDSHPRHCVKVADPIEAAKWCRLFDPRPERKPDSY